MVRKRAFTLFLTTHTFLSYNHQNSLRIKELSFYLNVLLLIKHFPAETESTLRESKKIGKCKIGYDYTFFNTKDKKKAKDGEGTNCSNGKYLTFNILYFKLF